MTVPGSSRRMFLALLVLVVMVGVPTGWLVISGKGTDTRDWDVVFDGYGRGLTARVVDGIDVIELEPKAAGSASTTHAVLALAEGAAPDFDPCADIVLSIDMRTIAQLRTGSPPNPWETAWFVWRYVDPEHFYYLTLKPNGWEIGKRDPGYPGGQRFLASGSDRRFPVGGGWHQVEVTLVRAAVSVAVDGSALGDVKDTERPYDCGRIGLYTEDAHVGFRHLAVAAPK